MIAHRTLLIIGLLLIAACTPTAPDKPPYDGIKSTLKQLLDKGSEAEWRARLNSGFKSGFGGEDAETNKKEFIQKITSDEKFRTDFKKVIEGGGGDYTENYIAFPAAWLNCKDEDYACGSQMRLLIDRTQKEWNISFYGAGD